MGLAGKGSELLALVSASDASLGGEGDLFAASGGEDVASSWSGGDLELWLALSFRV